MAIHAIIYGRFIKDLEHIVPRHVLLGFCKSVVEEVIEICTQLPTGARHGEVEQIRVVLQQVALQEVPVIAITFTDWPPHTHKADKLVRLARHVTSLVKGQTLLITKSLLAAELHTLEAGKDVWRELIPVLPNEVALHIAPRTRLRWVGIVTQVASKTNPTNLQC